MRINKVTAQNSQTKQREIFVFGNASSGKPILSCGNLCSYLDFCFKSVNIASVCVEVDYFLEEMEFVLSKSQSGDGVTHASLAQKQNGRWKMVAHDEEALRRVQFDLQLSFSALPICITAKAVEDFHGNLSEVAQLKSYLEAEKDLVKFSADTRAQKEDAARIVRKFSKKSTENVSAEQLAQAQAAADELAAQLASATQKLNDLRKIKCGELTSELEWIEQELSDVALQYDQLQLQFALLQDKRSRMEAAKGELEYVNSLANQNAQLNQLLTKLLEKQRRFENDKNACLDQLADLKESLRDTAQDNLSDICDLYIAECKQLEEIFAKLQSINSAISEATRTVKVNQAQIKKCTENAQKLVGEEDLAQAVQNFDNYFGEIESQLQMLSKSKQALWEEVFAKRLELEKTQWLSGEKGHNCQVLLKNLPEDTDEELAKQQKLVDELTLRQSQAELARRELAEKIVATSVANMQVTAATAQVGILNGLQQTLKHLDMASVLFADKISALLNATASKASVLSGQQIRLREKDGKLCVSLENGTFDYDELPLPTKTAVYLGLLLSSNSLNEKCLVFDQTIQSKNDQRFAEVLAQTEGVRYVIDIYKGI